MSMQNRDAMIASFCSDPDVTVFLMSLKAGGVALNLTAASHVMLMDPWWNPATEQQVQHCFPIGCGQLTCMNRCIRYLMASGRALNLTAALHVMLMDPWWNTATEQQV